MKKEVKIISIIFLILLVLPIMSAVEFDMKTNFSQGETLIARVSGNFLDPILRENIFFYRGHVRIPMEYKVTEIENEFYIYALLSDKTPNNYSVSIKDVRYMVGNQISQEDITKNFTITNNLADFSINPGVIFTDKDFSIEVQNLQNKKITIYIKTTIEETTEEEEGGLFGFSGGQEETTPEGESITLISGEIANINFDTNNLEKLTLKKIELSTTNLTYEIPIYLLIEEETQTQKDFKLEPSELNISLLKEFNLSQTIYIYNTGQDTLRNISVSISSPLNSYLSISPENIEELKSNQNETLEIYISSENAIQVQGEITAQTKEVSASLGVYLNFLENASAGEITITQTCSELGGLICLSGEECSGETINSLNGVCCLASCREPTGNQTGIIIGIGLILIIAVFLIWFFIKKYRKVKKPIDLIKIAQGKKPQPIKKIERPVIKRNIQPIRPVQQKSKPIIRYIEKPVIKEKIIEKPVIKEIEKKVFIEKPKKKIPKYIGSSNTKTFHKSSCKFAHLIDKKYRIESDDKEYFKKLGYKPGKVCLKK